MAFYFNWRHCNNIFRARIFQVFQQNAVGIMQIRNNQIKRTDIYFFLRWHGAFALKIKRQAG
jgi:hypothetical protein